ncbi:MAG: hypothetical protein DRI44_04760 [Chlamydiae bacterium]|nr:MAG: hypothetical protein DRI44_04760 [Chlamydiota bacterium]
MKKILIFLIFLSSVSFCETNYPQWSLEMKVWPFDILYPFQTGFATLNGTTATSDTQIQNKLDAVVTKGANTVIFYIDDEQTYETFVDETGFIQTTNRIQFLVNQAHNRNLKVVCYLNGLEVIAVGAKDDSSMTTLARNYPNWLQVDVEGDSMVWMTDTQKEWIPPKSEDAWASPLSPWKNMFTNRLTSLAATGLDGVYIDATFLPGVDFDGVKWASTDLLFDAAFSNKFGLQSPENVDWNSETWRKWIFFRHEVIRDYLGNLADTARSLGMVPFFESSSCDLANGTFLANDVAFTISGGIACSPEIEPEGDFKAAFRMSKFTRDANQKFPFWFLGWPNTATKARREFSVTLCHSGNYYPSAEAVPHYPTNSFNFMDQIRSKILNRRVPKQSTVLIYPMRSKDYSYESESSFESYIDAFAVLAENHIDFRILPLNSMTSNDLENIDNIVLAGAECISDSEYNLMKNKTVSLVGTNGNKNEWGNTRTTPLNFSNVVNIDSITPKLPFTINAPTKTYIEYYTDPTDTNHFYIFAYNDQLSGNITIENDTLMSGKVYEIDGSAKDFDSTTLEVKITDYLDIIDLNISQVPEPGTLFFFLIIQWCLTKKMVPMARRYCAR